MATATSLTVEILMSETGITDRQLDHVVEEAHVWYLAAHFSDCDKYIGVPGLGLTESEKVDVRRWAQSRGKQRGVQLALKTWIKTNYRRTYRSLIEILVKLNEENLAKKVCNFAIAWRIDVSVRSNVTSEALEQGTNLTIKDKIEIFKMRFIDLQRAACAELIAKGTSPQELRITLISLKDNASDQHEEFLIHKYHMFEEAKTVEEIFLHLNFYLSFLNYNLLAHIVQQFGSQSLRTKMNCYCQDMKLFRTEMIITDIMPYLFQKSECSKGHSKLQRNVNIDISSTSLEDLEEYRKRFASDLLLPDFAFLLANLKKGSPRLLIIWLVPTAVVFSLKKLLENKKILSAEFHVPVRVVASHGQEIADRLEFALQEGKCYAVKYLIIDQQVDIHEPSIAKRAMELAIRAKEVDLVKHLIIKQKVTVEGEHLLMAVEDDHLEIIHCLLTESCIDPNFENDCQQTPLSITKSTSAIKLLLQYGAVSDNTYSTLRKALGNVFSKDPLKSPVKIFVIGHGGEGKSTLIESMEHEPTWLAPLVNFFISPREVEGVSQKTAGIIPRVFKSRFYGDVLFYDFAGQEAYYSSHAAVIKSVVDKCPPIFLLVVGLHRDNSTISQSVSYWLGIVANQCTSMEGKAPLIVLGSHADMVQSDTEISRQKQLIQRAAQKFHSFELLNIIPIDCRYSNSDGIKLLRQCVENSSESLRSRLAVSLNSHMFLVYLLDTYSNIPAVTVEEVRARLTSDENTSSKKQKKALPFIPTTIPRLIEICNQLNDKGHILYLHNEHSPEKSFIIIDKAALLSVVSGSMFAPEDFAQHSQLSTSTGVVPQSKLAKHFPQFDIDMLTKFLSSLELAVPIDDTEILELIQKHFTDTSVSPSNDHYLFCPALIRLERPNAVFKCQPELPLHFGWVKTCTSIDQFFDARFLHILLLRLALSLGLASEIAVDIPAIQRNCAIWKTGICWRSHSGVEVLLEVVDKKKVLVLFQANHLSPEPFELRTSVIKKVNKAICELCPSVATCELIIPPTDVNYPLESSVRFSLQSVAESVVKQCPIVSTTGVESLRMNDLMEVYAGLGKNILQPLFNEADRAHDSVISDRYLSALSAFWSKNTQLAIIIKSIISQETKNATSDNSLLAALKSWRDSGEGTYRYLREVLDPISVFAGRSPLEIANLSSTNFMRSSEPVFKPATNRELPLAPMGPSLPPTGPSLPPTDSSVLPPTKPSLLPAEPSLPPIEPLVPPTVPLTELGSMPPTKGENALETTSTLPLSASPVISQSQPTHSVTAGTLSIEQLKAETGVDDFQLDTTITKDDAHNIAILFDDVDTYLNKLGLLPAQEKDVKDTAFRQGAQLAMTKALTLWCQPNPYKATFRALIEILLDVRRGDIAIRICEHISQAIPKRK